jgi:hypothetical protein
MNLGELGGLLQQFARDNSPDNFDRVAQNAPRGDLAEGLAAAFRSDQTPPFAHMLGQLFRQSNGTQRASILNQLIATLGPALVAQAAGGTLGRILSRGGQVSAQEAEQVPDDELQRVAEKAEQKNPSIVEQLSDFYAEHPGLVKTLGGAALTILMARMAQKYA